MKEDNPSEPIAIGVDIGGSHISSAAVNLETLRTISGTYRTGFVDSKATKEVIFRNWAHVINHTIKEVKGENLLGIGMAMPGPFDYRKGIAFFEKNDKYETLYNIHVGKEFQNFLSVKDLELRFLNDASSFGLGGSLKREFKDAKKIIAVTLGTGLGASFIKNGMPVISGKDVPTGGCLWDKKFKGSFADNYFSTRWFVKRYLELKGSNGIKGVKEIVEEGNDNTNRIFEEFAHNMSSFMFPYLKIFNADLMLLGGSIAKSYHLFLPIIMEKLQSKGCSIPVAILQNTEKASIIGSSYLFKENFWESAKNELPTR